jgi:hypothetical protein
MRNSVSKLITIAAAAAAVLGGGAFALASNASTPAAKSTVIKACENNKTHVLSVQTRPHTCGKGYTSVTWNQTGPQGATGAAGKTGATGPQGSAGAIGPQGPAGITTNTEFTEVDNGSEWSLSSEPNLSDTSASGATYADAGVVLDLGQLSKLANSDLAYTGGTGLGENLWIGNGPQASTPAVNLFSAEPNGADFCYLEYEGNNAYSPLDGNCSSYGLSGDAVTLAQIQAAFSAAPVEAYAWVGVSIDSNAGVSATSVTTIDGQNVNATVGIADDSGVLLPYVNG